MELFSLNIFSPDCDHCQEEAEIHLSKKDSLQNVKIIWVSGDWAELKMIKEFAENYQLKQLDLIAIGKETVENWQVLENHLWIGVNLRTNKS